ncbi:DMT family transporter [Aquibacillus kalidii]|uniref:DMT family transporter n=1 Tax=Aquibacillus kalidii TaxID=2762597 RepID=UPI0016482910|nr:DMT family transporter [Aquibacillus kalidii]
MIFVVIFYAGNIIVGKSINELPPFTIAFFRLLIAFFIIFPIGLRGAWNNRFIFLKYKKPLLIMTLTGITFFNTFIYGALQFTTASNVSVLETVIPVMTIVLSALLIKETIKFQQWIGIVLSFFGAILVIMNGSFLQLTQINWNIGDAIMIGAILCWAIYSIAVKEYMHLFPSYPVLLVMTGISVIVLLPFVTIEWIVLGIPILSIDMMVGLLYLGIFPSLIALIFYNKVVDLLGASKASVFLNFLPVVTMIGAYFWLGETISLLQIIGSLIVIVGVIVTTNVRTGEKHRKLNKVG